MRYVLNGLYLLTLLLLSPWLLYKAFSTGKHRRGFWEKISGRARLRTSNAPCAWFHGVSVGEIHLLKHVAAEFRKRHPDWDCVISTTTDTGYDEACKRFPDLGIFFWPFDFTWAVSRALWRVRPTLVVLAEGELWPNFLTAAHWHGVPVAVINGRMSPRSARRYQRVRWLVQGLFRKLALCAAQTEEYAAAFRALGARHVRATGSVKYDGACADRGNPQTRSLRELLRVDTDDLVWIAGSTQAPEEEVVLKIYAAARKKHANLRLVLVPRQKERFDAVAGLLDRSGFAFTRRSRLPQEGSAQTGDRSNIILMDTIGELGALWGLADLAFVGGSLDGKRGGQNMIEPAAYGAAVVFGPHVWNFKDTVGRLLENEAAVQVRDAAELEQETMRLLADSEARAGLGLAARRFVLSQQGATERTLAGLDQLLSRSPDTARAA